MDLIKLTRKLGAAIQQDERYLAFQAARKANEEDEGLNDLIGKLNLVQLSYQHEAEQPEPDENKLAQYDDEFRSLYSEIMQNPNMINYENTRRDLDELMNYIMQILAMCVNGEDPETCEPQMNEGAGCHGSCSSCQGC